MAPVRTALVLVAAASVALVPNLTTGAASGAASPLPTPSFTPTGCPTEPVATTLPENAHCGFLIVPENRARPNGRTIALTVGIVPSKSSTPAPDPVVYLAGGPGGFPLGEAETLINLGFNSDRDLIIISQRGTLYAPQTQPPRARRWTRPRKPHLVSRLMGPRPRA